MPAFRAEIASLYINAQLSSVLGHTTSLWLMNTVSDTALSIRFLELDFLLIMEHDIKVFVQSPKSYEKEEQNQICDSNSPKSLGLSPPRWCAMSRGAILRATHFPVADLIQIADVALGCFCSL